MIMKTNSYSEYSTNVNFIKFIAAIMVVISHSFPLSSGSLTHEWFTILTHGQYSMGGIAVCVFFFYSGLLITKSLEKSSDAKQYFINRIIRIIPPLAAVILISTFILGPCITSIPIYKYLTNSQTYLYLLNILLIPTHNLPGVFEHNIYLPTVNGSLWTLPIEAFCYIALFFLFKLKLQQPSSMKILLYLSILFDIFILVLSKQRNLGIIYSLILPFLMFFAGVYYYLLRNKIKMNYKYFILAILILILSNRSRTLLLGLYLCFPYILAYTGFACKKLPKKLGNLGKLSYGIYLCAFPIQQTLVWVYGGHMNIYTNILISLPLSIIGGWFLYAWIEKRIPSYKKNSQLMRLS